MKFRTKAILAFDAPVVVLGIFCAMDIGILTAIIITAPFLTILSVFVFMLCDSPEATGADTAD